MKEMTKLCAEAMGLSHQSWDNGNYFIVLGDSSYQRYDPIHDDAQAMALVKKFRLGINASNDDYQVWCQSGLITPELSGKTCTFNADLNRAIVECVAKMRAAKTKESA